MPVAHPPPLGTLGGMGASRVHVRLLAAGLALLSLSGCSLARSAPREVPVPPLPPAHAATQALLSAWPTTPFSMLTEQYSHGAPLSFALLTLDPATCATDSITVFLDYSGLVPAPGLTPRSAVVLTGRTRLELDSSDTAALVAELDLSGPAALRTSLRAAQARLRSLPGPALTQPSLPSITVLAPTGALYEPCRAPDLLARALVASSGPRPTQLSGAPVGSATYSLSYDRRAVDALTLRATWENTLAEGRPWTRAAEALGYYSYSELMDSSALTLVLGPDRVPVALRGSSDAPLGVGPGGPLVETVWILPS